MAGSLRYFGMLLRLLAALFLTAVLTPIHDLPGASSSAFISMMSSLGGDTALVVSKSGYAVTLYKGNVPIKTYRAVFGKGYAEGDKARQGDKRTPEGDFYICSMNTSKRFHKFLGLSYPDLRHAEEGLREGIISEKEYGLIRQAIEERRQPPWDTGLGGAVGIHGRTVEDRMAISSRDNWTDGCIALANADVDELFSVLSLGTPVTVRR
jgi:murein L,D-transpeptidase YafK